MNLDGLDHGVPAELWVIENYIRAKEKSQRQQHELREVRQYHRDHAAHQRVEDDDEQHADHDVVDVFLVEAGEANDELAAEDGKQPHVEGAGEGEDDAAEQAHAARVFEFVELGHGHHLQIAQAADDKAGAADDQGGNQRHEAKDEGHEAVFKTLLGHVHDRDQPEAGRDHRGDGHVGFEAAAGDEEVGDALDGTSGQRTGDDGAADIDEDDGVVNPAQVHAFSCGVSVVEKPNSLPI